MGGSDREIIDLTNLAQAVNFEAKTRFPGLDDADYLFKFTPIREQSLTMTLDGSQITEDLFAKKPLIKVSMAGRFWFDLKCEAVFAYDKIQVDGNLVRAEIISSEWTDLSDHSLLARFLRWILRRNGQKNS